MVKWRDYRGKCEICGGIKYRPDTKTCSVACGAKLPRQYKSRVPWNKGLKGAQTAWNKGLTKEDPRVAKYSAKPKDGMYGKQVSDSMKSIWAKRRETGEYEKVCRNMSMNYQPREFTKELREKYSAALCKAYAEGRKKCLPPGYKHVMKGKFKPINPDKYKGDPSQIHYRSGWELKMMYRLDTSPDVLSWSSEEVRVPYRSKVDGQRHTYFPDSWIKTKKKTVLVEIKPKKETQAPVQPKKQTKKYIREVITYAKNISKWESAREYAKSRGWEFQILTEHELGIK